MTDEFEILLLWSTARQESIIVELMFGKMSSLTLLLIAFFNEKQCSLLNSSLLSLSLSLPLSFSPSIYCALSLCRYLPLYLSPSPSQKTLHCGGERWSFPPSLLRFVYSQCSQCCFALGRTPLIDSVGFPPEHVCFWKGGAPNEPSKIGRASCRERV